MLSRWAGEARGGWVWSGDASVCWEHQNMGARKLVGQGELHVRS